MVPGGNFTVPDPQTFSPQHDSTIPTMQPADASETAQQRDIGALYQAETGLGGMGRNGRCDSNPLDESRWVRDLPESFPDWRAGFGLTSMQSRVSQPSFVAQPNGDCNSLSPLDLAYPTVLPVQAGQPDAGSIRAELIALQSRCAALESALVGASPTVLHHYPSHVYHECRNASELSPFFGDQNSLPQAYPGADDIPDMSINATGLEDLFDFNEASLPSTLNAVGELAIPTNQTPVDHNREVLTITTPSSTQQAQPAYPAITLATNITQRRHRCSHCMMTFRRPSDRDRHALAHNPDAPRFSCSFPGCPRVGLGGFLRRDKLTQHQVHMNH